VSTILPRNHQAPCHDWAYFDELFSKQSDLHFEYCKTSHRGGFHIAFYSKRIDWPARNNLDGYADDKLGCMDLLLFHPTLQLKYRIWRGMVTHSARLINPEWERRVSYAGFNKACLINLNVVQSLYLPSVN
jgi:hypothetical protein